MRSVGIMHFADLVLINGRFKTLAIIPETASAVAIRDGRFIAVGEDSDVLRFTGPATTVIDLQCRCVVPAVIESHTHEIHGGTGCGAIEVGRPADVSVLSENYFVPPAEHLGDIEADLTLLRGKVISASQCFRDFASSLLVVSPSEPPASESSGSEQVAA